jgi:hypothetical protein
MGWGWGWGAPAPTLDWLLRPGISIVINLSPPAMAIWCKHNLGSIPSIKVKNVFIHHYILFNTYLINT